jgi:serine 3-dehydrogenase
MKTILITGATAGFGEAAARKFVGGGWRAIGTGRRGDRLTRLQDELGDNFLPLEIDMRDREALESLARLESPWGDIDLLLNNAGLAPPTDPLPETDWDRIETVIDTNITGLVALTRALLPKLIERRGQIINLSSVAATYPYKGGAVYAGTKAFVRQFSLDLRCDLAGTGVRVTSIEPGMAETEFTSRPHRRRQASLGQSLCRHGPDDLGRSRWPLLVGRDPSAAPQHQYGRADAGYAELGRLQRPSRGLIPRRASAWGTR